MIKYNLQHICKINIQNIYVSELNIFKRSLPWTNLLEMNCEFIKRDKQISLVCSGVISLNHYSPIFRLADFCLISIVYLSIYILCLSGCLSVCLSVCLYPIKCQNG